jgi:predicted Fe-S protein YdhL (DUF1289 family)
MTIRNEPCEVPSPCVGVCRLDDAGRVCTGCGRTLSEIAEWGGASAERKRAILARLGNDARTGSVGLPGTSA